MAVNDCSNDLPEEPVFLHLAGMIKDVAAVLVRTGTRTYVQLTLPRATPAHDDGERSSRVNCPISNGGINLQRVFAFVKNGRQDSWGGRSVATPCSPPGPLAPPELHPPPHSPSSTPPARCWLAGSRPAQGDSGDRLCLVLANAACCWDIVLAAVSRGLSALQECQSRAQPALGEVGGAWGPPSPSPESTLFGGGTVPLGTSAQTHRGSQLGGPGYSGSLSVPYSHPSN